MSTDIYKKAQRRVKQKKGFFTHFSVFIAVGIFFFLMNMATDPYDMWFFFPLLPWGMGLMIHYFAVFGLPGSKILSEEWEQQELEKEIRRLRQIEDLADRARSVETESTMEQEEELDLEDPKKIKEKERRWNEKDFV